MTAKQVAEQAAVFRTRFGPDVLRGTDGEALLQLLHGRRDGVPRCAAYWLEFKNDDEFAGNTFGGIGGGSAMKFGIYQRQSDGAWMGGLSTKPQVLTVDEAVKIAQKQRDELVAGSDTLGALPSDDTSDEAYVALQSSMTKSAPELSTAAWSHKYWFLIHHDKIDDFHSPRHQRFHLIKLLQMPPDHVGIRDSAAPRFVCAGRFVAAARSLSVPITSLSKALNARDGSLHRYWRVGTTEGDSHTSHWEAMRDGQFVSIGWPKHVPNLVEILGQDNAKDTIRDWIQPLYPTSAGTATRKAGEILNFASEMAENDLVLACDGETVLGVGRIRGPYEYDPALGFPHLRRVEWLLLDSWRTPEPEGLRTTVFELGRKASNLLEVEQRLYRRGPITKSRNAGSKAAETVAVTRAGALPSLDPFAARVEDILKRKGQVIFYGPPGTGKTYRALEVARELAARRAFRTTYRAASGVERGQIDGVDGLVRICTFHPGFGYEDFVEGLRPRTTGTEMVFEPRDGLFKHLCEDAAKQPERLFFLIIDEINRGDVPRIFGELLTLIELDKRGTPVVLPVTGKAFKVPSNVCVIGTMNTADRSISLLDTALRRRFGFVELMPDSSLLGARSAGTLPLGPWLDAINERLRRHLKRDARNLQIGHAYLMSGQTITSVAEFGRVLRDDIIPLLEEYCYDDFATLAEILGKPLVDVSSSRIRDEMFSPTREGDLLQACFFEEMQPLVLAQGVGTAVPTHEDLEQSADADENADGSGSEP